MVIGRNPLPYLGRRWAPRVILLSGITCCYSMVYFSVLLSCVPSLHIYRYSACFFFPQSSFSSLTLSWALRARLIGYGPCLTIIASYCSQGTGNSSFSEIFRLLFLPRQKGRCDHARRRQSTIPSLYVLHPRSVSSYWIWTRPLHNEHGLHTGLLATFMTGTRFSPGTVSNSAKTTLSPLPGTTSDLSPTLPF